MLSLEIKKDKGVKIKGKGGELEKSKVLFGGIKKKYNKDEKKFTNRGGDCRDWNCYHNHSSFRRHRARGGFGIKQLSKAI